MNQDESQKINCKILSIIRFRLGKYAVSGDIEQMFHQILYCMKILWHENFVVWRSSSKNREIKMPRKMHFELKREIKMHQKIQFFSKKKNSEGTDQDQI